MPTAMRGVRGATTVDADDAAQITERVQELISEMLAVNQIDHADIASVMLSGTGDLTAKFPATAAREGGLTDVPLFGMRELDVEGAMPLCIRVLIHWNTDKSNEQVKHVFQHGARALRQDLVK